MNNIQTCKLTRKFATGENRKYYNSQRYSNRTFLTLKRARKLQTNKKNEVEDEIECNYYQLFIEPKGEHLVEKDKWKEELLLKIEEQSSIKIIDTNQVVKNNKIECNDESLLPKNISYNVKNNILLENETYKLIGLSFYNKSSEDKFRKEFMEIFIQEEVNA